METPASAPTWKELHLFFKRWTSTCEIVSVR